MPESYLPSPTPREDPQATSTPLKLAEDIVSNAYAKSLVVDTFTQWELWRAQNHDNRWSMHEKLYLGAMPQKLWPGTTVPRSNASLKIAFDQIETAIPLLLQSIFYDRNWFGVEAEDGQDPKQARNIQAHLNYICTYSRDNLGRGFESETEHFLRSMTKYGNGVFMLEWDAERNQVAIEWIDIRDVYIDPSTPTPFIDDSRGTLVRRMMTVNALEALRGQPGISIPPSANLIAYSRNRSSAISDNTKRFAEAARGVQFEPNLDSWTPQPSDNMVEVLIYYSEGKIIWLLGRDWVAVNETNRYGFVPLVSAPCYPVLSRFYAQGISDVVEDPQLYGSAIWNAHIDEMNLRLLPPRTAPTSAVRTPSSLRWYPGSIQQVDSPKDLIVNSPPGNMVPIESEMQFLDLLAQKHTGINAMSMGSVPTPSNANRSATGVNAQSQSTTARLNLLVKHFEQYALIPMFHKILRITQVEAEAGSHLPGVDEQGAKISIPVEDIDAPVRFRMYGASKMVSRSQLQQIFPFISQNLMGGPFLQQLNQTGQTVDFSELLELMQDATGASKIYKLVRPMSPEEKQALNQPNPQVVAQQQMHEKEQQTRIQMGQMKAQSDVQVATIKAETDQQSTAEESARHIMEMLQNDPSLALEFQQKQAELEQQMEAAQLQQKMQFAQQQHVQKLSHAAESHNQKLSHDTQRSLFDVLKSGHSQKQDAAHAQHSHKLDALSKLHDIGRATAESHAGIHRANQESSAKLQRSKAESDAKIAAMKKQASVLSKARPKPAR